MKAYWILRETIKTVSSAGTLLLVTQLKDLEQNGEESKSKEMKKWLK